MGATVVIAGSGRGAGKTAVGCALIRALPEWAWTAVKITPDVHEEASHGRKVLPDVYVESEADSGKSTSRYLQAGARRAVLVTVDPSWEGERIPELDSLMKEALFEGNLLVESNRLQSAKTILLVVTGVTEAKWKQSIHRCVDVADALVLTNGMEAGDLPERLRERRHFVVRDGEWAPAQLVEFLRGRLRDRSDGGGG